MPPLRQRLKRPETWLAAYALLLALVIGDTFRPPAAQLVSRGYIAIVRVYQRAVSPALSRYIVCRYRPTCSEYSIRAVGKYGLRRGLALTLRRLDSCDSSVPYGTVDLP